MRLTARWRSRLAALVVVAAVAVPVAVVVEPVAAGAAPGALDPSFGTGGLVTTAITAGATDVVNAVATQSDGKVVAAGYDQPSGGVQVFALARYNTDGTLDGTFGSGGKVTTAIAGANSNGDAALAVAVQGNGKIVVGGYTSTLTGGTATEEMALVRYNADGTLDNTFGTGGITTVVGGSNAFTNQINALAIDSSGRIVVAGQYDNGWAVARFTSAGALDTTFDSGGTQPGFQLSFPAAVTPTDNAYAVAIQPGDQKVVVAGSANGNADFGLARLATDGTLDATFGTGGLVDTPVGGSAGTAYGVAVQGDGNIVAVGQSGDDNPGDHLDVALARYNGTGALDGTFGTGGIVNTPIGTNQDAAGRAVTLQTDGQIVVSGYFHAAVGGDDVAVLRYSASNGQLDTTFGTGGIVTTNTGGGADDYGNAVALEPGSLGPIVAAGSDRPSGGSSQFLLARYLAAVPPSITKAFGAASIPLNGTTSLTLQITNPGTAAMTGVVFTDSLPAGLVVATPSGLTSTCGGTTTAVAGSNTVSLSGGSLAASANCSVVANVTGTSGGIKNNSVTVSSDAGTGNTANASLTVVAPPVIIKAFGAASIPLNGSTSLSFTIQNNNATTNLTGVGFTDTLPAGLVVSTPNGLTGSCGAGTITATAGASSVSLTGATIAASTNCTFSVNVDGTTPGTKNNTSGAVTSTEGGTGGTASASLSVVAPPPSITKAFGAASIPLNGTTSLTLQITNPGTAAMTGVVFTDSLPAGLVVATPSGLTSTCGGTTTAVAGSNTVSLSGGSLAASANCSVVANVTGTSGGIKNNSVTVSSDAGTGNTANASLTVVAPPVIIKAFGAASIPLNGSTSLSFTIQNNNATTNLTGVGFTDTLPAGLVVSTPNGLTGSCGAGTITATAGASSVSLTGATIAASTNCTFSINVTGTTPGTKNNTSGAVTSTEGGTGGTASATLSVVAPPSIAKSFSPTSIATGATSSLTFTITNPAANPSALTGVGFTDTLPTGMTVGSSTIPTCGGTLTTTSPTGIALTGATIATGAHCQFSVTVTATANGTYINTTGAVTSTNGGTGNTASASLTVGTATTTALDLSPNPSVFGQTVVFTATVSPVPDGGTVAFTDGGNPVAGCSAVALNSGSAVCSISTLSVGSHSIVATYSGDTNFVGSVSPAPSQTVQRASTTTTIASSLNPSVAGDTVTYSAGVAVVAPGAGAPGGTVAFTDGGTTISGCGAVALTAGSSTCSTSYASSGTHTIVATYSGDASFATSPSAQLKQKVVSTPTGYLLGAADGGAFPYGTATFHGSMGGQPLNAPVVGIASTPDLGGYWLVGADGGVFAFGDAPFAGSMGGQPLNAPVVGIASTPDGQGYWLVAADGGVFAFGSARFAGSMGGMPLNAPIVGIASDAGDHGYRLVGADGGVFNFGSAHFHGSMGGKHLNAPMVSMTSTPDGHGYWLVGADGGVFSFGSAQFAGSMGGQHLNAPMVGMTSTPDGHGYWLVGADGGVFSFGSAQFAGSMGGQHLNAPMVGIAG